MVLGITIQCDSSHSLVQVHGVRHFGAAVLDVSPRTTLPYRNRGTTTMWRGPNNWSWDITRGPLGLHKAGDEHMAGSQSGWRLVAT